jgi:hypothetical protein
MSELSRRDFVKRCCAGGACVGLVLAVSSAAYAANQYRAICRHGGNRIWRGPIRSTYAAADQDRRAHAKSCDFADNGVVSPGDPGWD